MPLGCCPDVKDSPNEFTGIRLSRIRWLLLCVALACTWVAGAKADDLAARIDEVLADSRLDRARIGVHVVVADSGRELYSHNADEPFIVASNQKLLTAACGLIFLGEDYEFATRLHASGEIGEKGVLDGDLIIEGRGDPAIGGEHEPIGALETFCRWADDLQDKGVRKVTGDIVADDSFFDRKNVHPEWPPKQLWKSYCAPVSALSANDNCVKIQCLPGGSPGADAKLSLIPDVPIVELSNRCSTSASKHLIWFWRKGDSRTVTVGGEVRTDSGGYTDDVTVRDPALYTAMIFRKALLQKGIQVGGEVRLVEDSDLKDEGQWRQMADLHHELVPALRTMVKNSQNLYAEQVIKTIGAEGVGEGSWDAGLARAATMLDYLVGEDADFNLSDGSGMSRENRLSPRIITSLLCFMGRTELGPTYKSLVAVSGEDGTLDSRLDEEPYLGAIRGKTGYLRSVGALSGYARTESGREVVFSVLINDYPGGNSGMKQIEDEIARAIVDLAP